MKTAVERMQNRASDRLAGPRPLPVASEGDGEHNVEWPVKRHSRSARCKRSLG